jgi:hypothetical protein
MFYCENCKKEVVIMAISIGAVSNEELEAQRKRSEREGILFLFNPPPFTPYKCPICQTDLVEK